MITKFENVLVLSPHTDDGELGCGGTIARLVENGKNVYYVAFSTADQSVPADYPKDILNKEVKEATKVLGIDESKIIIFHYEVRKLNYARQDILENLIRLRESFNVDLVLMPSLQDIHQDHETVAREGLRAFRYTTVLGYELLWNNLSFNTDCFVKLQKHHVDLKIQALRQYKSQSDKDYMSEEFVYSFARSRGVQINTKYAECFEVVRWVM